jgi:hypothetical protein
MHRGTMLVLSLLLALAFATMPQDVQARRSSPFGAVLGVLTTPLRALEPGRRHRSRAAHHHRRTAHHPRKRAVTAAPVPAATGAAAIAATATKSAEAANEPSTTGTAPDRALSAASAPAPAAHFGTVGPVAWPGAYEDVIGFTLWPKQYGTRLGAHGIGDVLSTAFAPDASIAARTKQARADATTADATPPACGSVNLTANDWPIADINSTFDLNDAQRRALDQLRVAIGDAIASIKSSCRDDDTNRGPVARLQAMQNTMWAVHDAAQLIRAPLAAFFAVLTDDQKRKFAAPEHQPSAGGISRSDIARMCDLPASVDAPIRAIEQAIQPTAAQRASLEALQKKSAEMGQFLLASCLAPVPEMPTQRLDAAANRLTAMIFAISNVNMALNDFTSRLGNEQKTKLDSIVR